MLLCKHCSKECKNDNSLRNHERLCPKNKDRVIKQNKGNTGCIGKNQFTKAIEMGFEKPIVSEETRKKLSDAGKRHVWDAERKLKHSIAMKAAVLKNPDSYTASNVCGRTKIIEFNGDKFHGKWEVLVAKWLTENKIKYEREVSPFEYNWNKGSHLYFPDFYIPSLDKYIEVKGYETERDQCKWKVVDNLIVIKKKEIKQIQDNKFKLVL